MSKIGKKPIPITDKVNVEITGSNVKVKGPKGELSVEIHSPKISVTKTDTEILVSRSGDDKEAKTQHGLYNSIIRNMIKGVMDGYEIRLSLVGVGYRVQKKGEGLGLTLGFSHPVEVKPVKGISFVVEGDTKITVKGIDRQLVGQVAADIRKLKGPEPYKGKGVRYFDEHVRKKAGKAGKKQ
ncbi:MAG: 50S ribosomal protein L6 [Candidatus Margulisbacteria bacterium]|nr:50S ribosomal protein L6 [Candidatus Margulisiibacteriota bacterium]